MLLPEPVLRHNGPSSVITTVSEQVTFNRQVVRLLHYIPERRGQAFDVIEDVIPLNNLIISGRIKKPLKKYPQHRKANHWNSLSSVGE